MPIQSGRGPVLGLNLDLAASETTAIAGALGDVGHAGVSAVRVRLDWAAIETRRGTYAWRDWDAIGQAARAGGVRLLATVDTAPDWSRHDAPLPASWWICPEPAADAWPAAAPPTDAADLAHFLSVFAPRYADVLLGIEVWREPNSLPHWRRGGPDPEDYGALFVAAARAIHTASPGVRVVSAGLAPTTDVGVCHLSDYVFLDRLARTGALADADAVGVRISGFGLRADHPTVDREVLDARRAELLARVLRRHGVSRPVWIVAADRDAADVEGGATAGAEDHATADAEDDATADAAWFDDLLKMARTDWTWLEALFVFGSGGTPSPASGPGRAPSAALVDPSGRLTTTGEAIARLGRGAPTSAALGTASPERSASVATAPFDGFGARVVHPWPVVTRRDGLRLVVLVLLAGLALAGLHAWGGWPPITSAARRFVAACAPLAGQSPWRGRAALVALLVVDSLMPWPLNAPLVPVMVAAAALWPPAALWTTAAAAPFYVAAYTLGIGPMLGPRPIGPVELLVGVAVAGAITRALIEHRYGARFDAAVRGGVRRRGARALDVGVIVLVAWAALTPLWAEEPALAMREWRTVILEPALVYGLIRLTRDRRLAARTAWHGLVVGAAVAAAWGLIALVLHALGHGGGAVAAEGVLRAHGPYRSPNNLALFLGRAVLGLASGWVFARAASERRVGATAAGSGSLTAWTAFVLCAAGLLATFSRGTILVGLPVALAWLVGLAGAGPLRRRALRWGAAVVVVVALALAPFAHTERVSGAFNLRPGTTLYYRVHLWQSAWRMGVDHPILGVGLDNFMGLYRDRYVQREVAQERFLSHPHNAALDWWTRLGLPGIALFGLWMVAIARAGAEAARNGARDDGIWAMAGFGSLVYGLAHGVLDNSFFLVDLAICTWIGQALVLSALDPAVNEDPTGVGPPGFEPGTNRL